VLLTVSQNMLLFLKPVFKPEQCFSVNLSHNESTFVSRERERERERGDRKRDS
jgi:hypothetical protein